MKKTLPILLLAATLTLILSVLLLVANGAKRSKSLDSLVSTSYTKEFRASGVLDFSIQIPSDYIVEEKTLSVELVAPDGRISISKSDAGFETVDAYVDSLMKKNKTTMIDREYIVINTFPAVSGLINDYLIYFIYAGDSIYSFQASSESLFNDLDQIAQSFRYTP
jgi:hypothetical protein